MKKHFLSIFTVTTLCVCSYFSSKAQSITIDPKNTASGIIDAKSTIKGFLMPRMSQAQRTAISAPTAGMQIYCNNCATGVGPYTYNGTVWVPMFNTAEIMYTVGQSAQGGIIFYVDDSGQHGLVAAAADYGLGITMKWINNSNINTNAVRSGIYGGQTNTELIIDKQGNGTYAAFAAAQFNGGDYGDWYLPSKTELYMMYQVKNSIGMSGNTNSYWSSTEIPANSGFVSETASFVNFSTGAQTPASKSNTYRVRAIRRF